MAGAAAIDFPFAGRVILLLGLATAVSLFDFYRRGRESTRFLEYGFVIFCGLAGSLIGAVNDAITSSLSPDYFILGKGLDEGAALRKEALEYGMKVGFSGGVISGTIALYAGRRKTKRPPVPMKTLLRQIWLPIAGAVAGALSFSLLSRLDPMNFASQLRDALSSEPIARFRQVWWIHVGLYTGLASGLASMLWRLARQRRLLAPAVACLIFASALTNC